MNNNRQTGRIGELLAASTLEQYNIRTSHVDIEGDDLWVKTPADRFFKVQVKSASAPILTSGHHTQAKYSFGLHKVRNYEGVVILVALDKRLCLARLGTTVKAKTIKLKQEEFTIQAQDKSICEAFQL